MEPYPSPQQQFKFNPPQSKKRDAVQYYKPQEIVSRFRSKADFKTYLGEVSKYPTQYLTPALVQYYLPPDPMLNKNFLRDIFQDKKKLMKQADIKCISVPKYDELSVKTLLPEWQANPEFWVYFPDKMSKDRVPYRDYFFTILNTLKPDYVDAMI